MTKRTHDRNRLLYWKNGFQEHTLSRLLEVVSHVKCCKSRSVFQNLYTARKDGLQNGDQRLVKPDPI